MTDFDKRCRFQTAIEVWIYFSFLEFWPGSEIGTFSKVLVGRFCPQYIVLPNNPVPDILKREHSLWRNLASKYIFFLQEILSSPYFIYKSLCAYLQYQANISNEKAKPSARRGREAAGLSRDGQAAGG